jgi:hypothetical protein
VGQMRRRRGGSVLPGVPVTAIPEKG